MHRTKMFKRLTDADNGFGCLYGITVLAILTSDKGICISSFHHHHAKIVTVIHHVISHIKCNAFTLPHLGKEGSIFLSLGSQCRIPEIDNRYIGDVNVQFLGPLSDKLFAT